MPLRRAVFLIACEKDLCASEQSVEDFRRLFPDAEPRAPDERYIDSLKSSLLETSGASNVDIDPENCHFSFTFQRGGTTGGRPWVILRPQPNPPEIDEKSLAEALFNKEGIVLATDEQKALWARQDDAIRLATGIVWRLMLRQFELAVSMGKLRLHARVGGLSTSFQPLPDDAWPVLEVIDWQNGIAQDPEGNMYYSMHADFPEYGPTVADETAAIKALADELARDSALTRAEAKTWLTSAGYKFGHRGFSDRIWPAAREKAKLSPKASPGRKPKSQRKSKH